MLCCPLLPTRRICNTPPPPQALHHLEVEIHFMLLYLRKLVSSLHISCAVPNPCLVKSVVIFFSHIIFIYDLRHKSCFYDSLVLNWSDRIYKNRYLMVSFGRYLHYCKQYKCRQFSFSHSERTSHAGKLYVLIRNKGIPVLFLTHTETSLNYYWLVQDYSHL